MIEIAYPLRCQPTFQNYVWGGRNLADRLGKDLPDDGVWAESWEIIDHPHHQSRILNGPLSGLTLRDLIERSPEWLIGSASHNAGIASVPLLLKYLDCQQVLSVQVHPDDSYALKMHPPDLGKTEAWYIVDAHSDAILYAGLKTGITREMLLEALQSGNVDRHLHEIRPRPGDCVFIPAGTIHALGAGILVAEIQQASNTTFRLFDWNRGAADGTTRPLHIEQALAVTDFQSGPRSIQVPQATEQAGRERLVVCDQFHLDRVSQPGNFKIPTEDTFHILTAPFGGIELIGESFREALTVGQSVLLPAALNECTASVSSGAVLLDMYVPRPSP